MKLNALRSSLILSCLLAAAVGRAEEDELVLEFQRTDDGVLLRTELGLLELRPC